MKTIETLEHWKLKSEIKIINEESKTWTSYYVVNFFLDWGEYKISKSFYPKYYTWLAWARKYAQTWIDLSINDE